MFLNAQSTNDMHSNNLNFLSSKTKGDDSSETGRQIVTRNGRSSSFGSNRQNGFVVWNVIATNINKI